MSGSRNRRELSRNNQAPTLQFEFPDLHRLPPRERMPVSNRGTCENQNQRIFTNIILWWNDLQVQWGLVRQLDMRNMTWLYILSTNPHIRTIQHCVPWTIHSQCLLAGISSIQQQLHAPDSALSLWVCVMPCLRRVRLLPPSRHAVLR